MPKFILTKIRSGREIDTEVVDADSTEDAAQAALGWLTDNERQFITYEAQPILAIDGVPVAEISQGVYEDADGNVTTDPMRITSFNGVPIDD